MERLVAVASHRPGLSVSKSRPTLVPDLMITGHDVLARPGPVGAGRRERPCLMTKAGVPAFSTSAHHRRSTGFVNHPNNRASRRLGTRHRVAPTASPRSGHVTPPPPFRWACSATCGVAARLTTISRFCGRASGVRSPGSSGTAGVLVAGGNHNVVRRPRLTSARIVQRSLVQAGGARRVTNSRCVLSPRWHHLERSLRCVSTRVTPPGLGAISTRVTPPPLGRVIPPGSAGAQPSRPNLLFGVDRRDGCWIDSGRCVYPPPVGRLSGRPTGDCSANRLLDVPHPGASKLHVSVEQPFAVESADGVMQLRTGQMQVGLVPRWRVHPARFSRTGRGSSAQ